MLINFYGQLPEEHYKLQLLSLSATVTEGRRTTKNINPNLPVPMNFNLAPFNFLIYQT